MRVEGLKEYLGIVVDMEQSIYLQKSLLSNITMEIERLKIPKKIDSPIELIDPIEPTRPLKKEYLLGQGITSFIVAFLISFLPSLIIGAVSCGLLVAFGLNPAQYAGALYIIPMLIVPAGFGAYTVIQECMSVENVNEEAMSKYNHEMETYKQIIQHNQAKRRQDETSRQAERQQDETERQLKTFFLQKQKEEVEKGLAVSEAHLQTIYGKGIIFPKYRNLVMVCSLYEYICAGRCTELEGAEGGYNILEIEIRMDRIILQLDDVITKLERIKNNQYALYSAVQETNRRLGQIYGSISSMSARVEDFYYNSIQLNRQVAGLNVQNAELSAHIIELQKTSELTAYHAERTQKELAYMNRMDYLSGRNDDVFFNHPPV